jgi:putative transposase
MARSRYKFLPDDPYPYFITATTVHWLPLFNDPVIATILINSLHHLIDHRRITIHAYVIMENHIHLVIAAAHLSAEIAKFKSFTARKCIDYCLECDNKLILRPIGFI